MQQHVAQKQLSEPIVQATYSKDLKLRCALGAMLTDAVDWHAQYQLACLLIITLQVTCWSE